MDVEQPKPFCPIVCLALWTSVTIGMYFNTSCSIHSVSEESCIPLEELDWMCGTMSKKKAEIHSSRIIPTCFRVIFNVVFRVHGQKLVGDLPALIRNHRNFLERLNHHEAVALKSHLKS